MLISLYRQYFKEGRQQMTERKKQSPKTVKNNLNQPKNNQKVQKAMNKQSKAIKNNQNQQKGLVVGLVVGFSGARAARGPWCRDHPRPGVPAARVPENPTTNPTTNPFC